MDKNQLQNLKNLNKDAILVDVKTKEVKTETGGIMDRYLKHFQDIMSRQGITNFKSAVIFSADLLAYWCVETKKFLRCSRNPVSSEKGQGKLFNKNADDRTVEPVSRRKARSKISKAIEYDIDWLKIDSWKELIESIKHAEEIKQSQEDKKIKELLGDVLSIIKNTPDSKKGDLLSKLQSFKTNLQTTEIRGKRVKTKTATGKKVA
tara:strand:- start:1558 stop:2175 length:618 start_codon:yes stop_codon:yes gene_type:complete